MNRYHPSADIRHGTGQAQRWSKPRKPNAESKNTRQYMKGDVWLAILAGIWIAALTMSAIGL